MQSLFSRIRRFDAYTKPLDDFRIKTLTGGAVTLISGAVMCLLFVSELVYFLTPDVDEEIFVDHSSGDDTVSVQFDLVFPRLACPFITVDVMDVSGDHQSGLESNLWKIRLNKDGAEIKSTPERQQVNAGNSSSAALATAAPADAKPKCGSCYGAESSLQKCCETCDDVRAAYARRGWAMIDIERVEQCAGESWVQTLNEHKGEGCRVYGSVDVARVAGNFHIAPGQTLKDRHSHVHDLHSLAPDKFDTSHVVNRLSFGADFPGKNYPIDGRSFSSNQGGTMFQYFVKVVPTLYVFLDKRETFTHQFSVTRQSKQIRQGAGDGLPGFFVQYDFSPLMIKFEEKQKSFTHFLVSVCAIIGGVFTVASLIDSFIYHSGKVLQQKVELGKAS